jgi:ABC-type transport system involved in multi-copper enzyme maturation permease subunit
LGKEANTTGKNTFVNYAVNAVIIFLFIIIGYLSFSLISNALNSVEPSIDITDTVKTSITNQPGETIQLEVKNGTSENGVAGTFTTYLRKNGFDVVEMGNYSSQDVERTMIIDRSGDRSKAKKIALALGVSQNNIIQQQNQSLYLDVSVIIGKDFKKLNPYIEKKN